MAKAHTQATTRPAQVQQGFTLIEIIAVLVILGILAATAAPKFMGLQEEAKKKAAVGAIAAAQSQLSMAYAQALLNGTDPGSITDVASICQNIAVDGVNATCEDNNGLNSTVTIYGCYGEGVCSSPGDANGTWTSPSS